MQKKRQNRRSFCPTLYKSIASGEKRRKNRNVFGFCALLKRVKGMQKKRQNRRSFNPTLYKSTASSEKRRKNRNVFGFCTLLKRVEKGCRKRGRIVVLSTRRCTEVLRAVKNGDKKSRFARNLLFCSALFMRSFYFSSTSAPAAFSFSSISVAASFD